MTKCEDCKYYTYHDSIYFTSGDYTIAGEYCDHDDIEDDRLWLGMPKDCSLFEPKEESK